MPSPFPGMNPYLEQEDAWHDFHERFSPACSDVLLPQISPKYIITFGKRVFIHDVPESERLPGGPLVDRERQSFVQILDRETRRVVTVIELLSPSNKYAGADRDQHVAKRQQLFHSRVHLVEIDLLRGGPRLPVEGLPPCDYYVMVSRTEDRPRGALWPIALRDRLPVVPIPLAEEAPPAQLDLQPLLDRIYDAAGYRDYIYQGAPQPALSTEDAEWARQVLVSAPSLP